MYCGQWTRVKAFTNHTVAEPLRCKCWTCEYCAPYRAARLRHQALAGKPWLLVTLTVNPACGRDRDHRARMAVDAWRVIRPRLMRARGYTSVPFLAVFEETQRGEPHLHILVRVSWIGQRWLSDQMRGLTGAPIVDVRQIDGTARVVNYVAKYIGKNPHAFKGCKRYWASHDYELPADDEDAGEAGPHYDLYIEKMDLEAYAILARQIGYVFVEARGRAQVFQYKPYHDAGAVVPP